jgi:hypothetical protein
MPPLENSQNRPARNIVAKTSRPDLLIKFQYANCLLNLGFVPDVWKIAYLDSIKNFNQFIEHHPKKLGPSDFLSSFDDLCLSISQNGFSPRPGDEILYMKENGYLVNAAHRTAICAALDIDIPVTHTEMEYQEYDFNFCTTSGASRSTLGLAMLTKVKLNTDMKCLILHGVISEAKREFVKSYIANSLKVIYSVDLNLNQDSLILLKYINYVLFANETDHPWFGDLNNDFEGLRHHAAMSAGKATTIYFIEEVSERDLVYFKSEIRSIAGYGNYSVHTCETYDELLEVAYFSCHPQTLNYHESPRFQIKFDFLEFLRNLKQVLTVNKVSLTNLILGGSAVMEIFDLRKSRDIDIFSPEIEVDLHLNCFDRDITLSPMSDFALHNLIQFDEECLFRYAGFSVLSLRSLSQLKSTRGEFPKDFLDLEIISEYLGASDSTLFARLLKKRLLFFSWKVNAVLYNLRLRLIKSLYRVTLIRTIVGLFRRLYPRFK